MKNIQHEVLRCLSVLLRECLHNTCENKSCRDMKCGQSQEGFNDSPEDLVCLQCVHVQPPPKKKLNSDLIWLKPAEISWMRTHCSSASARTRESNKNCLCLLFTLCCHLCVCSVWGEDFSWGFVRCYRFCLQRVSVGFWWGINWRGFSSSTACSVKYIFRIPRLMDHTGWAVWS